jgi:hypothetical protein
MGQTVATYSDLWAVVLATLVTFCGHAATVQGDSTHMAVARFPDVGLLPSPSGQYRLENRCEHDGSSCTIWLLEVPGKKAVSLFAYSRNVDLAWSPDESVVAIGDNWASNESRIVLLPVVPRGPLMNLSERFRQRGLATNEVRQSDHVYFRLVAWSTRGLRFRIDGYGAPGLSGPFCQCWEYQYDGSFQRSQDSGCGCSPGARK